MTYIGQQPATTFDAGIQDRFTGLSTNTVTLTHEIAAEEDILVVWNNIVQDKNTYSVGGTGNKTLTLGGTLVSADVVTVYYLNKVMQSVNPTAGSVNTTQLADTSITAAKLNTALLTGHTDIGANIADADLFLIDDGAGGTLRKTAASRLKTYAAPSLTPDNLQYFSLGSNATMSSGAATTLSGWGTPSLAADLIYNYGTQYVTHSSGVFSFSTEGYYHVAFRASGSTAGASDSSGYINITTNNSAYSDAVDCNFSKSAGSGFNFYMDGIFKITDTSNHKLTTSIYAATNDVTVAGNTTRLRTYIRFQRIGTAA